MFRQQLLFAAIAMALCTSPSLGDTIWVPDDQSTIQDAINAAVDGDTVIVRADTYYEDIDFCGKSITVRSVIPYNQWHVENTIIHGSGTGSVVTFANGEGLASVLAGFTITNGTGLDPNPVSIIRHGGGIYCKMAQPTIRNNIIRNNTATHGAGIYCEGDYGQQISPRIISNTIKENIVYAKPDYLGGGGIYCMTCSPWIFNNEISRNTARRDLSSTGGIWGHGGGVYCTTFSSALVENNIIHDNNADIGGGLCDREYCSSTFRNNIITENDAYADGAGISINRECTTVVEGNVIYFNIADPTVIPDINQTRGGGIRIAGCSEGFVVVKNNLIYLNQASLGGGIFLQNTGFYVVCSSNTVTENTAYRKGGGFYFNKESHPFIEDSIFWNNLLDGAYPEDLGPDGFIAQEEQTAPPSSMTIQWSNLTTSIGVWKRWETPPNQPDPPPDTRIVLEQDCTLNYSPPPNEMIDADPLFLWKNDPDPEDWENKFLDQVTYSPCIDAANPFSVMILGTTDQDGNPDAGILDMGFHYPVVGGPQ